MYIREGDGRGLLVCLNPQEEEALCWAFAVMKYQPIVELNRTEKSILAKSMERFFRGDSITQKQLTACLGILARRCGAGLEFDDSVQAFYPYGAQHGAKRKAMFDRTLREIGIEPEDTCRYRNDPFREEIRATLDERRRQEEYRLDSPDDEDDFMKELGRIGQEWFTGGGW